MAKKNNKQTNKQKNVKGIDTTIIPQPTSSSNTHDILSQSNDYSETKRLIHASEETNRWLRNIESIMWMIASILLGATGFTIKTFFEINNQSNSSTFYKGFLCILMGVLWSFFLMFLKDIAIKSQNYIKKAENYEQKLGIDINAFENGRNSNPSVLDKDYHSPLFRLLLSLPRLPLMTAMAIISWGMIVFWILALTMI